MTPFQKYEKLVKLVLLDPDAAGHYDPARWCICLYDYLHADIDKLKEQIETITTKYRLYFDRPWQKQTNVYILDIEL